MESVLKSALSSDMWLSLICLTMSIDASALPLRVPVAPFAFTVPSCLAEEVLALALSMSVASCFLGLVDLGFGE